jgi:DNA-binding NarL/FixJ family response regulator
MGARGDTPPVEDLPAHDLRASRLIVEGEDFLVVSIELAEPPALAALTPAQQAVIREVLRGASNQDIARTRGVSVRTVANQLAAVYRKLGVRSRAELARLVSGR